MLTQIKNIVKIIRIKKKYKEFKNNSIYGENLRLEYTAHCISKSNEDVLIGNGCEIKGTLYSFRGGKIKIGNNLYMGYNSYIGAMDSIEIGNDVIIASNVRIFDNNNHPTDPEARREMSHNDFYGELWTWQNASHKPIIIEENVWIGEYSAILKGVKIGVGSIVASHSVVTKEVPPYCIVAGNPAKVVKQLK